MPNTSTSQRTANRRSQQPLPHRTRHSELPLALIKRSTRHAETSRAATIYARHQRCDDPQLPPPPRAANRRDVIDTLAPQPPPVYRSLRRQPLIATPTARPGSDA